MSFNKKPRTINPDEVDPSVYYYDEIYDEMKEDEKVKHEGLSGHSPKDKKQGSKYIQGLKETAELRKVEKELRKFKRYARDREEAEADGEFSEKEVYITSAYKERLKEMKTVEDERRKLLELEEGSSMNFIKRQKVAKEIAKEVAKEVARTDPVPTHPDTPQSQDLNSVKKKRLVTLEERREYLRKFLAKRTVGKVYEEAVRRYWGRKALAQQ